MKNIFLTILLSLLHYSILTAQVEKIDEHIFFIDSLDDQNFKDLINSKLQNSQFILLGEQHGIKEVGEITGVLYDLAQPFGYNKLCIETDEIAAVTLSELSKFPIDSSINFNQKFPFSIPFYNNYDDVKLFKRVTDSGGDIWGIDQTFMTQFRLNFDYLIRTTSNDKFKNRIKELKVLAEKGYHKAIVEKNYMAPYIFSYDLRTHNELLNLAKKEEEKEVIKQLWNTKEIYGYNFSGRPYLNNSTRATLMKRNFMMYYNQALEKDTLPKVVFKLGANHVAKGLSKTNIYDVSNLISELAIMNNKSSLHIYAIGIDGEKSISNPFAPIPRTPFDNTETFPIEIQKQISNQEKKFLVLDLTKLRLDFNLYSDKLQDLMFKYDLMILIKNCNALESFTLKK